MSEWAYKRNLIKGRTCPGYEKTKGVEANHMLVAIDFVPTRRKKIAVDVVPAAWQLYIEH